MNLLIVDDEYYNVEALKMKIGNSYPQFSIYCAYSEKQALKIFAERTIDIMIADIEMPAHSGLELLETLRSQDVQTVVIFLTAYAKFEYISQAIRLESIDYLLKPVSDTDLFASIDKAVRRREEQEKTRLSHLQARYWKESELYLIEQVWQDLLSHSISSNPEGLERTLKFRNLDPLIGEQLYFLLFVQCNPCEELMQNLSLYEFAFKNIAREYFYHEDELPVVARSGETLYLLALPAENRERIEVIELCSAAMTGFVVHFPNTFCFYISERAYTMSESPELFAKVRKIGRENISLDNLILDLSVTEPQTINISEPIPTERWSGFLADGRSNVVQSEALLYLTQMQHNGISSRSVLMDFYYQMLHLYMHLLKTHQETPEVQDLQKKLLGFSAEEACSSYPMLKEWVKKTLHAYYTYSIETTRKDNSVRKVKQYIREHLAEDMSRDSLAAMVYLNADYLSHLFKRETGYSLTNYIIEERIRKSRILLADKNLNISDIAISCGFQNISYFSRQFKKSTGMTPREFRRQAENKPAKQAEV